MRGSKHIWRIRQISKIHFPQAKEAQQFCPKIFMCTWSVLATEIWDQD